MKNKLAAMVLGTSLLAMTGTAVAAPENGNLVSNAKPVSTQSDIIAEKVTANPEMHCMELFFSMYLEDLEVLRVEATQKQPEPVVVKEVSTQVATSVAKTPVVAKKATMKAASKPVQAAASSSSNTIKTASGSNVSYSKMLSMRATAYSSDSAENGGWGAVDYFGNPLKLGTIAVDPNVIPLNSKLYIVGYNSSGLPVDGMMATASDVGGAIKGNKIDIFIPGSQQLVDQFGIQQVKVYVLK